MTIKHCDSQTWFHHESLVWASEVDPSWSFGSATTFLLPSLLAIHFQLLPLRLDSHVFTYSIEGPSWFDGTITIAEWYKVSP